MKIALAALAILFVATAAQADSTTVVDVVAPALQGTAINLNAQFTLEQVTGEFFNSYEQYSFYGTEWEVVAINGTLNGNPMMLVPGPQGQNSWLNDASGPADFGLGLVYFTADGSFSWLENDNTYDILNIMDANGDGQGTFVPVAFSAVDPVGAPEPSTYAMLITGIVSLLALFRLAQKPQV